MKRCPECRRDYYDDSLLYCLDDGSALLDGPATLEPNTEIISTGDLDDNVKTTPHLESPDPVIYAVRPRRRRKETIAIIAGIAVVLMIIAAGIGLYRYELFVKRGEQFQNVKITRATNEGNVFNATISPDGKYIAYVTLEGASFALWTKHLATNSRVQIATQPGAASVLVMAFSNDSNYVYYGVLSDQSPGYDVYQTAVLGGSSKKVLSNVSSCISLSPDGRQAAFGRSTGAGDLTSAVVANLDGSGERTVIERHAPEYIATAVSWSPDSKLLAMSYSNGDQDSVVTVRLDDGRLEHLGTAKFNAIEGVAWLSDGRAILAAAQKEASETTRIWLIDHPGGEPRLLTNELDNYSSKTLSVTTDSRAFLGVMRQDSSAIYISQTAALGIAQRVSTRSGANDGVWGLSFDRAGRLFSVSEDQNKSETWVIEPGSVNGKLVMEEAAIDSVTVTPDGSYLVYISKRGGTWQIWRSDINGGNAKQLTSESSTLSPGLGISPDSRWIYYSGAGPSNIKRVSIDGGDATIIAEVPVIGDVEVSPNGIFVSCAIWDQQNHPQIQVYKIDGNFGSLYKTVQVPRTIVFPYHWSSDSRAIVYADTVGRVSNLWMAPVDGGQAHQITDFNSDTISNFAFSFDGKQLALARGPVTSDAVLVSSIK